MVVAALFFSFSFPVAAPPWNAFALFLGERLAGKLVLLLFSSAWRERPAFWEACF